MIPSPRHARLRLKNRASEFERVVAALAQWQAEGALPADAAHDARLVLEEAFTNIVNYAHSDGREHEVDLALHVLPDRLDMVLDDDGVAFDPTAAPGFTSAPASSQRPASEAGPAPSDAEPPLGMIGLQLMRAYATTCRYERRAGRNVLSLSKHFTRTAG